MKDTCKGCNEPKFIVNKSKYLCDDCNCIRQHGVPRLEWENQKRLSKTPNVNKRKKPHKPTNKALKEIEIKSTLKHIKNELHVLKMNQNEYLCKGCSVSGYNVHLDCSHILSVGQRKDLECEPTNIQLLCRDCHKKWESQNKAKLLQLNCLDENLEYLKQNDNYRYQRLLIILER